MAHTPLTPPQAKALFAFWLWLTLKAGKDYTATLGTDPSTSTLSRWPKINTIVPGDANQTTFGAALLGISLGNNVNEVQALLDSAEKALTSKNLTYKIAGNIVASTKPQSSIGDQVIVNVNMGVLLNVSMRLVDELNITGALADNIYDPGDPTCTSASILQMAK